MSEEGTNFSKEEHIILDGEGASLDGWGQPLNGFKFLPFSPIAPMWKAMALWKFSLPFTIKIKSLGLITKPLSILIVAGK